MTWNTGLELNGSETNPFWAIRIKFRSAVLQGLPYLWTTRGPMTIGGDVFETSPIHVEDINRLLRHESIILMNDGNEFTERFLDEDHTGSSVDIWEGNGLGSTWNYADLVHVFQGTMGAIRVGPKLVIRLSNNEHRQTPGVTKGDVIPAEWLVPDGAVAITPDGKTQITFRTR